MNTIYVFLFIAASLIFVHGSPLVEDVEEKPQNVEILEKHLLELRQEVANLAGQLKRSNIQFCPEDIGTGSTCQRIPHVGCYCVVEVEKRLEEADEFCQKNGMTLVSIETRREWLKLSDLLRRVKGDRESYELSFWTSGWDEQLDGQWTWTATGEPLSFTHWKKGLPNNRGGNNKALMIRKEEPFEWWDVRTVNLQSGLVYGQYFICEV